MSKIKYSPYYTALIGISAFLIWYFDITAAGIFLFAAIFATVLLLFKDTTFLIPLIILCTFMISEQAAFFDYDIILYIVMPILVISFVVYFILKRPKLIKGKFFYGFLLASLAMVTGGIGFDYNIVNVMSVAGLSFAAFFVYIFFNSTGGEDLKRAVLDSFIAVVIVILLQIFVYYIRGENFIVIVTYKYINVGWGISNNMAFVLSMLLPITFYRALNSKHYIFYLVLAIIQYAGIVLTMSRGNIIFGGLAFAVLFIICFKKTKEKYNYMIIATAAATMVLIVALIQRDIVIPVLEKLLEMSLGDNGRIELLIEGLESFKLNPIFGIGFFYKHALIPNWFHNFPIQILASMGIIGVICYGVYFYQRYSIVIKNFNLSTFFMISAIILSGLYGLMECNFFFIYNMIFIMFLSIIIEKEKNTYNLYHAVKNKFKKT